MIEIASSMLFLPLPLVGGPPIRWTRRIMPQVCRARQSQGAIVTYATGGPIKVDGMRRSNRAMGRSNRAAFTMIELMVAIGILIILVGILMFAMKHIGDSAKAAETKTALESARGLLAELESK